MIVTKYNTIKGGLEMSKRIVGTTPKVDGFRMPGEFEEQEQIWMLWPWRNDNWRLGAKPAQKSIF